MNKLKLILTNILLSLSVFSFFAQEEKEKPNSILNYKGGSVDLRTMHLWRGIEVTGEMNVATDIHFKTKNDAFKIGLWGGAGINGGFQELDYFASYSVKGFTFAFWDVYNFSHGALYNNNQAFNYIASETGHFLDLSAAYQFQKKYPLRIFWSTIVFGRDRGLLSQENRYSTFVQLGYPIFKMNGLSLDASVAGAFALKQGKDAEGKTSKANFYGDTPGIVDINLCLRKDFYIAGYKLPVYVMPMWNPQLNIMNMQFGVTLFSL